MLVQRSRRPNPAKLFIRNAYPLATNWISSSKMQHKEEKCKHKRGVATRLYKPILKPYPGVPSRRIFSASESTGYDSFQSLFPLLRCLAMVYVEWTTTIAFAWTLKVRLQIPFSHAFFSAVCCILEVVLFCQWKAM